MEFQLRNSRLQTRQVRRSLLPKDAIISAVRAHPIIQLQGTIGNHVVSRLLQDGGAFLSPSVRRVVSAGGTGLEPAFPREAERGFGEDLSAVRVHTDLDPARSADVLDADAYTYGNHIAFPRGKYAPQSNAGRQELAHEVAHVVQQRRGGARLPSLGRANNMLEQSADVAASAFARGRGFVDVQGASSPGVARLPRSLNQSLDAHALRDDELQGEINEI